MPVCLSSTAVHGVYQRIEQSYFVYNLDKKQNWFVFPEKVLTSMAKRPDLQRHGLWIESTKSTADIHAQAVADDPLGHATQRTVS